MAHYICPTCLARQTEVEARMTFQKCNKARCANFGKALREGKEPRGKKPNGDGMVHGKR